MKKITAAQRDMMSVLKYCADYNMGYHGAKYTLWVHAGFFPRGADKATCEALVKKGLAYYNAEGRCGLTAEGWSVLPESAWEYYLRLEREDYESLVWGEHNTYQNDKPNTSDWKVSYYRKLHGNDALTVYDVLHMEHERCFYNHLTSEGKMTEKAHTLAWLEVAASRVTPSYI